MTATPPPVDPAIAALLEAAAAQGLSLPDPLTPEALRAAYDRPIEGPPVAGIERTDHEVPLNGRTLQARLYRPQDAATPLPVVLFLHGGGWVHGTLDTHETTAAALAREGQCAVLSLAYRLAPEHPFPAAFEDALDCWEWLAANGRSLGLRAERMAVAGDSAGGNLAAALAAHAEVAPVHQVLFYPALDSRCDYAGDGGGASFLTGEQMRWYWRQYVQGEGAGDSRAAPSLADDFAGLPPTTIILAGHDPLRDEGRAYAAALRAAGVDVELHEYEGGIHGFASLVGLVEIADDAIRHAATRLNAALAD